MTGMENITKVINEKTDSIGLSQNAKGVWSAEVKVYGDLTSNPEALLKALGNATEKAKELLKTLNNETAVKE